MFFVCFLFLLVFFFKQKTAYEMRISDWSSDVCSSDLSDFRNEGRIKHLGLTNFDTERMQIMTDSGLQIVSNQVQYSIIDRRPEVKMIPFCMEIGRASCRERVCQ